MLPTVKIMIWDKTNVRRLTNISRFIAMLKIGEGCMQIEIGDKVHIQLMKDGKGILIGQATVAGQGVIPLGRMTDDMWAIHVGPNYIEELEARYNLGRFREMQVLLFKELCLAENFADFISSL